MFSRRILAPSLLFLLLVTAPARAAAIRVISVEGDAEVMREASGESAPLAGGEELGPLDRVVTGMDSQVQVAFADDSVVIVRELTDVKIGEFAAGDDSVRTRLWLKAGEVSAEVSPKKGGSSDFAVKTPTATCSVRGTGLDVGHNDGKTTQRTRHGSVFFFSQEGRTLNGANQSASVEADGDLQTDTETKFEDTQVISLPSGSSENEQDAIVENGSPLTNTGAGVGGTDGSSSQNDVVLDVIDFTDPTEVDDPDVEPPGELPDSVRLVAIDGAAVPSATFGQTFIDLGLPAIGGDEDSGNFTYFVGRGAAPTAAPQIEGVFQESQAEGLVALYTNAIGATYITNETDVQFSQFSIDGYFTLVERPSIDADESRAAFAAIFSYVGPPKIGGGGPDRVGGPPEQGIFIHESDPVPGTPNLYVVADTAGSHGTNFTRLSDDFDLDGANVFFVSEDPDVQRIQFGNGSTISTVLLEGTDAPVAPQTPTGVGGGFIGGPDLSGSFQTFADDPCNPTDFAFRDLSAHHYDSGLGSPIQTLSFVGHHTNG